jgi:hypothetical protein
MFVDSVADTALVRSLTGTLLRDEHISEHV